MLLVFGTEAAVQRAAVLNLSAEFQRDGARFIELDRVHVHLGIGTDDALEPAVGWAPFPHVDFVVLDDYLGVYHSFALGTDAARQFMENVVRVLFYPDFSFICGFDDLDSPLSDVVSRDQHRISSRRLVYFGCISQSLDS